ncbi:MAG: AAA family ATPase [Eubacterium sp.]|nr:AAA family ATPase [Candidatus Colimonas fimequi]
MNEMKNANEVKNVNEVSSQFDQIIGYEKIKKELMKVVDMVKRPEVYEKLGAKMPHGILLDGEPGLGKTLMARCFIEESGLNSITLRKSGKGENFTEEIEKSVLAAIGNQPCILLMDDMDKYANEDYNHRDAEEYVAVQAGFEKIKEEHADVLVIGTVNQANKLPKSLLRAGRFDIKLEVEVPKYEEAEKIFAYYMRDKAIDSDVDVKDLTKMIKGCSCAELEQLLNDAAMRAGFDGEDKIHMHHMIETVLDNNFGVETGNFDAENDKACEIAMHEAGHVVVAEALQRDSVGFVSINGDEDGEEGGITSLWKSLNRTPQNVMMGLAGKVASELYFGGHAASGAQTDLIKSYKCLKQSMLFNGSLGYNLMSCNQYDDDVEKMQMAVVAAELQRYEHVVRGVLIKNRALLEAIRDALLCKGILLNSEIQGLVEEYGIVEEVVA